MQTVTAKSISKTYDRLKEHEETAYRALAIHRRDVSELIICHWVNVYVKLENDLRSMTVDDDATLDVYAEGLWVLHEINDRMARLDHLLERLTWD